jgi:molybdopterin-guanine dinucleotide biosynthesis protein A
MQALTIQSSISIEQLFALVKQLPTVEKKNLYRELGADITDDEADSKIAILSGLKEAMHEVQLHQSGKITLQTGKEWLNGL